MAAVFAPLDEVEKVVDERRRLRGHRQRQQHEPGGASAAPPRRSSARWRCSPSAATRPCALPVSHAFHTEIVARAAEPLRDDAAAADAVATRSSRRRQRRRRASTRWGPSVDEQMLDILGRQVASPVQFVKGLRTLYDAGARVFVEIGPKRALQGFVDDVLGDDRRRRPVHQPPEGRATSRRFNQALCGLYAAGPGRRVAREQTAGSLPCAEPPAASSTAARAGAAASHPRRSPPAACAGATTPTASSAACSPSFLDRGHELLGGGAAAATPARAGRDHRRCGSACPAPSACSTTPTSPRILTASSSST